MKYNNLEVKHKEVKDANVYKLFRWYDVKDQKETQYFISVYTLKLHIDKATFQKCIYIRKYYTHVTRFQHYKTIFLTIHIIEIFSCLPLRVCKRLPGLSFVTIKHVYRSNVYLVGLGLHLLAYQDEEKCSLRGYES